MRENLVGGNYQLLSDGDIAKIHKSSISTLEEVGVEVNSERAMTIFRDRGAHVDHDRRNVRIPKTMVEDAIAKAPSRITLCGRDPEHDLLLENKKVSMGTGGTALYVLDGETGKRRASTLEDVSRIVCLVDSLENIDFYVLPVYPSDLPREEVDVNRFCAGLSNTRKHVMGGVYTRRGIAETIKLAEQIAGGREHLRRRPIISFISCIISPLKIDSTYGDMIIDIAESGMPLAVPAEPQCGTTAPVTLVGNLVLFGAEVLAGITLAQLVNPGTPILCGYVGTIADMRTMEYVSGAVEMGLLNAAAGQLAQYWTLPFYATGGMSDSELSDVQCGYEKALNLVTVALSGANYIHDAAGLLESALTVSYIQYVIDNEVLGMVRRILRGIEVNERTLGTDVISTVGPGGNFLVEEHTLANMKSEFFFPDISNRLKREKWLADGGKGATERANKIAQDILSKKRAVTKWPAQ